MPRRPASITQADVARIIRAARQAGAAEVELRVGDQVVIVRLQPSSSLVEDKPAPVNFSL